MITRRNGYLHQRVEPAPEASAKLQHAGYVMLRNGLDAAEVDELRGAVDRLFAEYPPSVRRPQADPAYFDEFRYEALNRSEIVQRVVAHSSILEVVKPLLGDDCHVIANTAWRNQPDGNRSHGGLGWHMDSGPHVPRPSGTAWPPDIPYPIFVVAVHVLLAPMPIESGPTGVIPGSHTSGTTPPRDRHDDVGLTWNGQGVVPLVADTGDIVMFVSDIWHRRLPPLPGDPGRDFLQIHYGRRDIAQRLRPTAEVNHLSAEAIERAGDAAELRSVVGLHDPFFYDG